jgi:aspartyl-tRNA(Asn)/glutamyl-tRNA(Gln) amidotransferase subunit A
VDAALGVLRKLTAGARDVALPAVNAIPNLVICEAYAYHQRWLTRTPQLYQVPVRKRIEAGAKLLASEYAVDLQEHVRARREIRGVFRDVDLLITPTMKYPARTIVDAIARNESEKPLAPDPGNTSAFNVYGLPTITIPCGFTKLGLPIGLQISGPHFQEGRVLALARAYEQATPWHTRRPEPPRG